MSLFQFESAQMISFNIVYSLFMAYKYVLISVFISLWPFLMKLFPCCWLFRYFVFWTQVLKQIGFANIFCYFVTYMNAFISFSYLVALPKTSSKILKRSDESRYLCAVPDFQGKAFSPSSVSVMVAVGFS